MKSIENNRELCYQCRNTCYEEKHELNYSLSLTSLHVFSDRSNNHREYSFYLVLKESTIFILAALNAGSTPPTKPMMSAKAIAFDDDTCGHGEAEGKF